MKKALLVAIIGALSLSVNAGDWGGGKGVAPKAPKAVIGCPDTSGNVAVGYETAYMFYGARLAEDSVWASVDYTFDLGLPVTIGAWYLNEVNPATPVGVIGYGDELDLTASVELPSVAGFDVSVGYTRYIFPQLGLRHQNEYGLDISRDLGFATLLLEANYNSTLDAWYHQAGLEKEIGITDSISLVLGGGLGYSDNYAPTGVGLSTNSGWNHYYFTASLPITLNCSTTITPYVGYVGAPDGFVLDGFAAGSGGPQSDVLHGGISINVSF